MLFRRSRDSAREVGGNAKAKGKTERKRERECAEKI